tara:strand:+ start:576 stop:710 length:135 start_codon:yes stop_codon:yes gene_type:complete
LFARFQLAEHLHKTVAEINEIDHREWLGWLAYFKIRDEDKHGDI